MTRTVLTVDDSRTMRDMLRMALAGAGFNVVEAVDGEHGLVGDFEPAHAGYRTDRLDAIQIGGNENRAPVPRNDHVSDPSVCDRTAHKGHITQAREAQVSDELTAPAHQPIVFFSDQARLHHPCRTALLSWLRFSA